MATRDAATSNEEAQASNHFESERAHQWVDEGTVPPEDAVNGREATESSVDEHEDASSESRRLPLGYTRCPECNARKFVAKQLVYETRTFDETGAVESIKFELRGELEFVCAGCDTCLREMPAARRTFYSEVGVLQQDLRCAVGQQVRVWIDRLCAWAPLL